ncbi:UNVERIFIED_CONTAM: hypothetical protein GTU68_017854 [Idotea baltica]|nr:hypothetical protein [Idotea baltica]
MKIYHYPTCSSCKKTLKILDEKSVSYNAIDISEKAPSIKELKTMLKAYEGNIRKLFNTSGKIYREGGYKDKLDHLSVDEALKILANQGMLVKRPFILANSLSFVGFNQELLEKHCE